MAHELATRASRLFSFTAKRELKELYIFQLLFSFAFSLIIIYEPIFFWQQGIPLAHICLYYALHYSLYVVLMPLGAKVAARFGLEHSLALATPFFVLYFLTLAVIPYNPSLFWLAIVILTVHKIFYWPAYHAHFATFTTTTNKGTEQSWMRTITYGAGILGPAIGGVIAMQFGFPVLFVVAAATVLLAGFPLLRTRERFQVTSLPYGAGWRIITSRRHRRMVVAMLGWGEDLILLVCWPVWMFIILGSTEKIGIVAAVGIAVMTLWGFVIGELIDRRGARWVLRRLGVPLLLVGNLLRVMSTTPLRVIAVDVGLRVANINFQLPFLTQLYSDARRTGVLPYALAFETTLAVSKAVVAWGLFMVFLNVSAATGFTITFYLAAALSLLYGML